jgi:hypothetical protein
MRRHKAIKKSDRSRLIEPWLIVRQHAYVKQMLVPTFTTEELVCTYWSPEAVRVAKDAYEVVSSSSLNHISLRSVANGTFFCSLGINFSSLKMASLSSFAMLPIESDAKILAFVQAFMEINIKFKAVKNALAQFDDLSDGQMKTLCPSLGILLPADGSFNLATAHAVRKPLPAFAYSSLRWINTLLVELALCPKADTVKTIQHDGGFSLSIIDSTTYYTLFEHAFLPHET